MTKHSENTQNATCDNNMLANRLLKFRVYYELDNEVRFWHIEFKQEEKRLSIPQVYTNGRILGVVQFTGFKDFDGKEVYEGDIVYLEYGKGVVEYSEKQAMFIINWIGDNEAYNESLAYNPRNYIYGKTRKDIEVIGNIYENSEFTQSSE